LKSHQDPFRAGPLSDSELADDDVRYQYDRLVKGIRERSNDSEDDEELPLDKLPAETTLEPIAAIAGLLDYQEELVQQILKLATNAPPNNIGLVSLPTGAGKTRTAVAACLQLLKTKRARSFLWLAPSRELLEQAVKTFEALWPSAAIGHGSLTLCRSHLLKDYPRYESAAVYFSTPQMLYQRISGAVSNLPIWDFIVFDEAHQASAPTFSDALLAARKLDRSLAPCIGLSATPGRYIEQETNTLIAMFNRRLLTSKLLGKNVLDTLKAKGALAELQFKIIPVEHSSKSTAPQAAGDAARFRAIVALCQRIAKPSSTIIFAGSVRHSIALALVLRHKGISADWVSSVMPNEMRRQAIRRFEAGESSVLINKSLLATGYDCPSISNAVLAIPVKSPILFEQMVGRASRGPKLGGNAVATIWSFDDHLKWHGEPSSYGRFSLSGWR
jgi:DNA repair protein RadD